MKHLRAWPRPAFSWLGYVIYLVVALRVYTFRSPDPAKAGPPNYLLVSLLLGAILLLLLSDPFLFRRFPVFRYLYFPLQLFLIQALGLQPPYQDMWGLLYAVVCVQAFAYLPVGWALGFGLLCALSLLGIVMLTLGFAVGAALGLFTLAGAVMIVSYEVVYRQIETQRQTGARLVAELQDATRTLESHNREVEELSTLNERNRLASELHDAVGQTVFSIALLARSARLMVEKDPQLLLPQLDELEKLTGGTLAQMRALIQEWRPPPAAQAPDSNGTLPPPPAKTLRPRS